MQYLSFFINMVGLEAVDFYNNETHAGNSFVPFIGFMAFLIGLAVVIVGLAIYFTASRNFNLFYDQRDVKITYQDQILSDDEKAKKAAEKLEKDKKKGKIVSIVGVVMMVLSFFILQGMKTPSAGEDRR